MDASTLAWSPVGPWTSGLKRQPRSHGIDASGINVIPPKLRQATNSQMKSTIAPGGWFNLERCWD